jgi:rod shape-determining protein MreD
MVRGLISFVTVGVAVIIQLTIIDRIAFPGGTGPDLVLLAVAALAVAGGPLAGTLIGFWGGLALDVAPPGSHFVGQNALVFCLVGYFCGLAAEVPNSDGTPEQGHTALFEIVVTAAGAVCGEALSSLLGAMLSDPRVTWTAIKHVLPVAVAYDVLLCPFVLYAAAAALRLAGTPRRERDRAGWAMPAARTSAGAAQGAIRQVNGGNTPRLRLSERGKGDGLGGSLLGQGARGLATSKREPRLKLSQSGSLGAAYATSGARRTGTTAGALGGGAAKVRFATRRGEGTLGGSVLGGTSGGTIRALNSSLARSRFNSSQLGRSLLGGSVFSRSPSALRSSAPPRKSAPIGRSAFLGRSPFLGRPPLLGRSSGLGRSAAFGRSPALGRWLAPRRKAGRMRSAPGGSATGYAPRLSRPGMFARLTGALRGSARHQPRLRQRQPAFRQPVRTKSPGRGWLRGSSSGLGTKGRGWSGRRTPRLGNSTPRLHMPRPKAKKRWRTGGYR